MNKKFIIVFGVILSILIILGIVVIIYVYKGKGELSVAKSNEIILNENLKYDESLVENDNVIQETEQEITKEDIKEETIESTQIKEKVDNKVNQSLDVEKTEIPKETVTKSNTQSKENTQKQTSVEQDTTNKETKVVDENKPTETQSTPTIQDNLKCANGKHYMEVGNVGKWFDTQEEAIAIYNNEIKDWANKLNSNEITSEEYYKKCPLGYEVWSCLCGKWTINYYYR